MNDAAMIPAIATPQRFIDAYAAMSRAIGDCYALRGAMQIERQASAIEAAVKVVSDADSLRRIRTLKLMAWRRIGEIIIASVDFSGAETISAQIKLVKQQMLDDGIAELSDAKIVDAIKIATIPREAFDAHVGTASSRAALIEAAHPATIERRKKQAEVEAERKPYLDAAAAELLAERNTARELEAEKRRTADILLAEHEAVVNGDSRAREVGYTLTPQPGNLQRVTVLLTQEEYELLRRAQMEHRDKNISRWEIMRQGLRMWLMANGYELPQPGKSPGKVAGKSD